MDSNNDNEEHYALDDVAHDRNSHKDIITRVMITLDDYVESMMIGMIFPHCC